MKNTNIKECKMKQLVVYIYLICFCNLAKGNILTTDSVYANVIFSDLSNGSLYVRIHGGVFSARCDSVISFKEVADLDIKAYNRETKEWVLMIPNHIRKQLKDAIATFFISGSSPIYAKRTENNILIDNPQFLLNIEVYKKKGLVQKVLVPLQDIYVNSHDGNCQYSPSFMKFIQMMHFLYSASMGGLYYNEYKQKHSATLNNPNFDVINMYSTENKNQVK